MFNLLYVFSVGLLVSFLGTLPLSALNVTAMQISTRESIRAGVRFSLGVAVVEVVYLRTALQAMGWVMQHQTLFYWLGWVTVAMLVALAVVTFIAAFHPKTRPNPLFNNKMNRFVLGGMMSGLNPVQIPFWVGWSTYLLTNRVLLPRANEFNAFTVGGGLGTLIALAIFIWGGNFVIQKLNANQQKLDIFVGCVFVLTALIQTYKVLYPHGFH